MQRHEITDETVVIESAARAKRDLEITQAELRVLEAAQANHIWLNAMQCIRPTPEFLKQLGKRALDMLNGDENLIPAGGRVGDRISELTPCLVLYVNKS
jgi:hypothetical protein